MGSFLIWEHVLACFVLLSAFTCLIILIVIDFRERLLPNKYVFPFAALGLFFHALTQFSLLSIEMVFFGGLFGYGLLWVIRAVGSWYYKQEALGLGDVKLMGAAGLWLGAEYLMLAMVIGASLSIVHGVIYAVAKKQSLRRLQIPAGPGLIGGILVMICWMLFREDSFFGNLMEIFVS